VRGPASSVYGTNALGGVLNLIPRRGTAERRTELVAEGGSFGTRRAALSHGGTIGDIDLFLSLEGTTTSGYMNNTRGEDMDWETRSVFTNVGYADEQWDVRAYLSLFTGEGTDEDFDRDLRRDLEDVSIAHRSDPDRDAETKLRVYRSGLDQTLLWFDRPESGFEQASLGAILTQSYRVLEDHLLVAGAEWRHEQAEAVEVLYTVDEREATWSAFLQDEWDVLEDLGLVVGGRYDKRSGVDGEFGWRGGFNLRATEGTTVRGAVGRAYRFPTISDRLLPPTQAFGQTFAGNPDLEPETLLSVEIGVDQQLHERVRASVTGFTSRFEDFWDFVLDTDGVRRPLNIGEVRVRGVETAVSADLGAGLSATASYTFTDAEYEKFDGLVDVLGNPLDVEGNRVDDTAVHAGSISVVYRHPDGHSARFGWQLYGNRYSDPANTKEERLDGFDVADLTLVAALCREVAATLSVQNLFNSGYRTDSDFRQPGRAIFAGLRLTFGPR
ncbi:MAG: TonB-dependent receptor plug domain-containing protein, partial [Planctomycetota bacterium]